MSDNINQITECMTEAKNNIDRAIEAINDIELKYPNTKTVESLLKGLSKSVKTLQAVIKSKLPAKIMKE